jgi:LAO/AO transport system kinase
MPSADRTAADLVEPLLEGDKRALARAISLVENDDPEGWALVREVYPRTGRAAVVGFTGPPGVGKSTLIGRLVEHARAREREVAVLSIDPSSPFTQGALLGDRIRRCRTTSSTRACSSARWRAAARSAACPRRRFRRRS